MTLMYRARHQKDKRNLQILFEHKEGIEFIIFDLETSGTDPEKDRIVELSARKYVITNRDMAPTEELHIYIKPPFRMSDEVVNIHHITNDFLEDKPNETAVFGDVFDFFGDYPIVIGHNIKGFDVHFMRYFYERNGEEFHPMAVLDTLDMVRDIVDNKEMDAYMKQKSDIKSSSPYNLGNLVGFFGLDCGIEFHTAAGDTLATARLLRLCYEETKRNPPKKNLPELYVNGFWYWAGMNKNQAGVWVNTAPGRMFFSTYNKAWFSSQFDPGKYDLDSAEKYILGRLDISYEEFCKLTEKKYETIKAIRRKQGVRI